MCTGAAAAGAAAAGAAAAAAAAAAAGVCWRTLLGCTLLGWVEQHDTQQWKQHHDDEDKSISDRVMWMWAIVETKLSQTQNS